MPRSAGCSKTSARIACAVGSSVVKAGHRISLQQVLKARLHLPAVDLILLKVHVALLLPYTHGTTAGGHGRPEAVLCNKRTSALPQHPAEHFAENLRSAACCLVMSRKSLVSNAWLGGGPRLKTLAVAVQ